MPMPNPNNLLPLPSNTPSLAESYFHVTETPQAYLDETRVASGPELPWQTNYNFTITFLSRLALNDPRETEESTATEPFELSPPTELSFDDVLSKLDWFAGENKGLEQRVQVLTAMLNVAYETVRRATAETTAITKERDELKNRSQIDETTGILNGAGMRERVENLNLADGKVFISLIDIGDFKRCNDMLGHAKGDRVLQSIAGWLALYCRQEDLLAKNDDEHLSPAHVGRPHGDEFIHVFQVLSDSKYSADEVKKIMTSRMHQIRDLLFEQIPELKRIPTLHIDVGMVEYDPELSYEENLALADIAMYEDKRRQRIRFGHVGRAPRTNATKNFVPPSYYRKQSRIRRSVRTA